MGYNGPPAGPPACRLLGSWLMVPPQERCVQGRASPSGAEMEAPGPQSLTWGISRAMGQLVTGPFPWSGRLAEPFAGRAGSLPWPDHR